MTKISPKSTSEINYWKGRSIVHFTVHQNCNIYILQHCQRATHHFTWLAVEKIPKGKSLSSTHTHLRAAPEDSSGLILMIPMWFIQQIHDQRSKKGIQNWPNKPYLHFVSHSAFWKKTLWRANEGTLSQKTSEMWHISSGIIVLCVSVAHFPWCFAAHEWQTAASHVKVLFSQIH